MNVIEALTAAKSGTVVRPKSWSGFTQKLYVYYDPLSESYRVYIKRNKNTGIRLKLEPELALEEWEECSFLEQHEKKRGA